MRSIKRDLASTAVALLLLPLSALTATADDEMTKDSALSYVDKSGRPKEISTSDFNRLMTDLLLKDGASNVHDAVFLFQQCFGGGFIAPLETAFKDSGLRWVAASASAAKEFSMGTDKPEILKARYGERTTEEERKLLSEAKPMDFWTKALTDNWQPTPDMKVVDAINKANDNSPVGASNKPENQAYRDVFGKLFGQDHETGQLKTGGGGEQITLTDKGVNSRHAILWEGIAGTRTSRDTAAITHLLEKAWGPANGTTVTIKTVSSLDALSKHIAELKPKLGPQEQFFFYADDHGTSPSNNPFIRRVPKKTADVETFSLWDSELAAMADTLDNVPLLTINYTDLTTSIPVYLGASALASDRRLLGYLPPGASEAEFQVEESLLNSVNTLTIDNTSDADFTLQSKHFTTGPLNSLPDDSVPEPANSALLAIGLGACAAAGRRRGAGCGHTG